MKRIALILALLPLAASAAISDLLTTLENTRVAITNAIVQKGGTASGALTNAPAEILALPTGGGGFTNDYIYVRGFTAAISAASLITNNHATVVGMTKGETTEIEGVEKLPVTVDWIFNDATYADDIEFFVRAGDFTNGWVDAQITNYTILASKTIDGTTYANVYEGVAYFDTIFSNAQLVAFTDVSAQGATATFDVTGISVDGETGLTGNYAATNAGAVATFTVNGGAVVGVASNVFDFASTPRATVAITINAADWAYIPTGSDAEAMLDGAYVLLSYNNNNFKIPVTSFAANTHIAAILSLDENRVLRGELHIGHGSRYVEVVNTRAKAKLTAGATVSLEFNLNSPDRTVRQIGRAQITSFAAASSGSPQDFLVVRDFVNGAWVTRSGHYDAEGEWQTDTGFVNGFPLYTNNVAAGWSTSEATNTFSANFPWSGLELVDIRVNGWTGGATNLFKFSKIPLYYVKFSQENIEIPYQASGTTNSVLCNIWWVSANEGDGFTVADWEKIYRDGEDPLVKSANYYARYKSCKSGVQSYPWPNTASGYTRQNLDTAAKVLNNYTATVYEGGTNYTIEADSTNRRWSGNTWLDYQAFAFLSYIQFGADAQATIWGNVSGNPVSGGVSSQAAQNTAETIFDTGLTDFILGPNARASCNFAWLGILNFWGSEGDQMCDVQGFACREDSTNFFAFAYQPDHALLKPGETSWDTCLGDDKYTLMPFRAYWAGSYTYGGGWRGSSALTGTAAGAYWIANAEGASHSLGAMNLRAVDNLWLPGYPSQDGVHNAYMVSLSCYRGSGSYIGPWYVFAGNGVGASYADYWGSRLNFVCPK